MLLLLGFGIVEVEVKGQLIHIPPLQGLLQVTGETSNPGYGLMTLIMDAIGDTTRDDWNMVGGPTTDGRGMIDGTRDGRDMTAKRVSGTFHG